MILEKLSSLSHWQIDLVAFWLLLQGAFFSSVPEEVVILALGVLWGHDKISFIEAFFSICAGLLPANLIMVLFGQRLSRGHTEKKGVKIASEYLKRYGVWVIFLIRFTPLVRAPVYFSVGATRFGIKRFIKTDWAAACIQVPMLLILARSLSDRSDAAQAYLPLIGWSAGGILASVLAFTIGREILQKRQATLGKSVAETEADKARALD
jgi:membrane protein DedA with SNARE-associated domain